jgi:hypothetical protein
MKTFILILALNGQALITQEFDNKVSCVNAAEEFKRNTTANVRYSCSPKGSTSTTTTPTVDLNRVLNNKSMIEREMSPVQSDTFTW